MLELWRRPWPERWLPLGGLTLGLALVTVVTLLVEDLSRSMSYTAPALAICAWTMTRSLDAPAIRRRIGTALVICALAPTLFLMAPTHVRPITDEPGILTLTEWAAWLLN